MFFSHAMSLSDMARHRQDKMKRLTWFLEKLQGSTYATALRTGSDPVDVPYVLRDGEKPVAQMGGFGVSFSPKFTEFLHFFKNSSCDSEMGWDRNMRFVFLRSFFRFLIFFGIFLFTDWWSVIPRPPGSTLSRCPGAGVKPSYLGVDLLRCGLLVMSSFRPLWDVAYPAW